MRIVVRLLVIMCFFVVVTGEFSSCSQPASECAGANCADGNATPEAQTELVIESQQEQSPSDTENPTTETPVAEGATDGGVPETTPSDETINKAPCKNSTHCPRQQACVKGFCDKCKHGGQCGYRQGCLADGSCGACTQDKECEVGKRCREGFCTPQRIREYNLIVDKAKWKDMISPANLSKKLKIPCSLEHDSLVYKDCKVRPRGESSLAFPKLSLRVEFPENAKHPGYARKINLRAEYNDKSYMRAFLAHETFRRISSIPSPRVRYVRLKVNGEDQGIYAEIERIGGKFLDYHRRDRNASMYEADPPDSAGSGITALIPLPSQDLYQKGYDQKSGPADYSDLIHLIEKVIMPAHKSGDVTDLKKQVNMDLYLDYLALMVLVQNRDHFWKNYYFSRQKNAKGELQWEFYPWDLDLSFGCFYTSKFKTLCKIFMTDSPSLFGTRDKDTPVSYPIKGFYNLLADVVLKNTELRGKFRDRVCKFISGDFWNKQLPKLIKAYKQLLLPEIASDKKDRVDGEVDFVKAVAEVELYLSKRKEFLAKELFCSK